jgi:molybdate transport system substrate-binding protein
MTIHVLSAGAAQGVVTALAAQFHASEGCEVRGTFGAVGAMKEKLLAGEPCDLIILSEKLIEELAAAGQVRRETVAALGRVRTGVAVRAGEVAPAIGDSAALRAALKAATGLYFPDPQRATAGIHFVKVLESLGIRREVEPRLRPYPNGAVAMREMARSGEPGALGVTQITEIRNTPGVELVGPLPSEHELATVYSLAVCVGAAQAEASRRFAALLAGGVSRKLRSDTGFEF